MSFKVHHRVPKRVWRREWSRYPSLVEAIQGAKIIIRNYGGPAYREARVVADECGLGDPKKPMIAWYSKDNT